MISPCTAWGKSTDFYRNYPVSPLPKCVVFIPLGHNNPLSGGDDYMWGSEMYFNANAGYFEGLVRGFRAGILTQSDYMNLILCEDLDGACLVYFLYWDAF